MVVFAVIVLAVTQAQPLTAGVLAGVPTAKLSNGFELPVIGLGMGPWCNAAKCPAPANPCADCYDNASAAADVILAASVGITFIDTALGYGNQGGVGDAVRRFPGGRSNAVVQTKVPPCGGKGITVAECEADTRASVEKDFAQLNLSVIDVMLLHAGPSAGDNGTRGDDCGGGSCALAVAQWRVMEKYYWQGRLNAIGVSNWCQRCFECLKGSNRTSVTPMVNQIQYHAGMGSADPDGLISYCKTEGVCSAFVFGFSFPSPSINHR